MLPSIRPSVNLKGHRKLRFDVLTLIHWRIWRVSGWTCSWWLRIWSYGRGGNTARILWSRSSGENSQLQASSLESDRHLQSKHLGRAKHPEVPAVKAPRDAWVRWGPLRRCDSHETWTKQAHARGTDQRSHRPIVKLWQRWFDHQTDHSMLCQWFWRRWVPD